MNVMRLPAAVGGVAALLLSACSGLLFIDERSLVEKCETYSDCGVGQICADGVCEDAVACSPVTPTGEYCPEGLACVDGVCAGGGRTSWCDCTCDQGCQDGACVEVTTDNECSPSNLDGPCLCGDVCVAGTCLPLQPPCAPNAPTGLCPSGASCVNGYCVPIDTGRCGPSNLDGLCPAGQECRDPGSCQPIECVPACTSDTQACLNGTCIDIPCSPNNPDGACDALDTDGDGTADLATACSHSGECVPCPAGLPSACCGDNQDCGGNQFCSAAQVDEDAALGCTGSACARICVNNGTCLVDEDCGGLYSCNANTCERDYSCTSDTDCCPDTATPGCTTAELCSETAPRQCIPQGSCLEDADCRDAGRICAVDDVCLDVGRCNQDADCRDAALECSSNGNCIDVGSCATAEDCPPAHICNSSNECVPDTTSGDTCTTNDFVAPGTVSPSDCDPAALRCCSTGTEEDCCPQGERCSTFGDCTADSYNCLCVPNGECVTDADCLEGAAGGYFLCVDYQCLPQQTDCVGACTPQQAGCAECSGTDVCSYAGGCIPENECADDRDCLEGEKCNANFRCETAGNCGAATFNTTLVKPNVLIVLDRSGSMQVCNGSSESGFCGAPSAATCEGSGDYCDQVTSSDSAVCEAEPACSWSGGACIDPDYAATCDALTASGRSVCEANPECAWTTAGTGACIDLGDNSRWQQALLAIDDLTFAHNVTKDDMRFGITVYPARCGTSDCPAVGPCTGHSVCDLACNYYSCFHNYCADFYEPGINNVAVGDANRAAINDFLQVTFPGGATPTGGTLRAVLDDSASVGLAATDRENVILLITDGEANGKNNSVDEPGCGANDFICEVNSILAKLVDLPNATVPAPSIKTYVIGFAFDAGRPVLNCHATHGGTSRCATPAECSTISTDVECDNTRGCTWTGTCQDGVDDTSCDAAQTDCYYRADDAATLVAALDDIIGSIASCAFILDPAPPDAQKLFVELDYGANPLPGSPAGADCTEVTSTGNCRLDAGPTSWLYDDATKQIEFYGARCDDVQGGLASPQVIYGCPGGEG